MEIVAQTLLQDIRCFRDLLVTETSFSAGFLKKLATPLAGRYRYKTIDKQFGGIRPVSMPSLALKRVQVVLKNWILSQLTYHDAAHSVLGRSSRSAMAPHAPCEVFITCDVHDFFSHVHGQAVIDCLLAHGACERVARWISGLCTDQDKLPQGTSTSPALANAVAFALDEQLTDLAQQHQLQYTRYVDDLLFSSPAKLSRQTTVVLNDIRSILAEHGMSPHRLRIRRPHQAQVALGLVLNPLQLGISGSVVRVPRQFKRRLRAALYQEWLDGVASLDNTVQLRGKQAHVYGVEEKP